MKPFTLLIKPSGSDCNLNCAYCCEFFVEDRWLLGNIMETPPADLDGDLAVL